VTGHRAPSSERSAYQLDVESNVPNLIYVLCWQQQTPLFGLQCWPYQFCVPS